MQFKAFEKFVSRKKVYRLFKVMRWLFVIRESFRSNMNSVLIDNQIHHTTNIKKKC